MKKDILLIIGLLIFCIIGVVYAILEDKLELVILAASVAGGSFIVRKLFRK